MGGWVDGWRVGGWMDGGMDVVSHGHTLFRGTGCGHVRLGWVGEWMDGKMETNRANRKMERTGEPREKRRKESRWKWKLQRM